MGKLIGKATYEGEVVGRLEGDEVTVAVRGLVLRLPAHTPLPLGGKVKVVFKVKSV